MSESPRVFRRVFCSTFKLLFQACCLVGGMRSPFRSGFGSRSPRAIGPCCTNAPISWIPFFEFPARLFSRLLSGNPGPVQAKLQAAVPKTQGLPTHLHAVRQARRDVFGLPETRPALNWQTKANSDNDSNSIFEMLNQRINLLLLQQSLACVNLANGPKRSCLPRVAATARDPYRFDLQFARRTAVYRPTLPEFAAPYSAGAPSNDSSRSNRRHALLHDREAVCAGRAKSVSPTRQDSPSCCRKAARQRS